jgi:phage baseplate assembly protein V
MIDQLRRLLQPLQNRVAVMIGRCILRAVNDATAVQLVQLGVRADELRDRVEHFQPYGITAHPLPGAAGVVLYLGGMSNHPVAVSIDDPRYRPTGLLPGEVKLYDHLGKFIYFEADGTLRLKAPKIVIEADELAEVRSGDTLKLYAAKRRRTEVYGYAEELEHTAGVNYTSRSWHTGAIVTAEADQPIEQPEVG